MRNFPPKKFVDKPFGYHQVIELDITDLNNLGNGVGRIDGWVVVVPMALAGERVRASVFRNHKNFSEADLVEVVKPSPERCRPVCPIYDVCGGCQYQHLKYSAQLEWKARQVRELFRRIGGVECEPNPTIGSPEQYAYRSKLTPHFEHRAADGSMPIGFIKRGSRNAIVDVENCPIASNAINAALPEARAAIRAKTFKRGGTLLLRDTDNGVVCDNNAVVTQTVNGIKYKFCAGEFFQNNPFILPKFIDYALTLAEGCGADRVENLVDAYCGVGTFSIPAAKRGFKKVLGVEISAKAIACARENALINGADNCYFTEGKAEAIFEGAKKVLDGCDTAVLIDPPRAGCDKSFLTQLADFNPKRIVYVSCAPDTQARDVAILVSHGYRVLDVQPFDLFPQTRHIENICLLARD